MRTRFLFPVVLLSCCAVFLSLKNDPPLQPIPHYCFDAFNDSSAADLAFFDTIVPRYRLFLIGEVHGVAVNPRLEMKMIRYLYAHAQMRHLVIEYGPGEALLYQRYLDTGDESWVEDSWQFKMPEYVRFWRELYAFNRSLKEKIDVIGLDFDSDHLFAKALVSLFPEQRRPNDTIRPMIDSLLVYSKKETSFMDRSLIDRFSADFSARWQLYRDYFGEEFGNAALIAQNHASYDRMKDRDRQMATNFMNALPDTFSYFGMFGSFHTYLGHGKSFATMLNEDPDNTDFNGKILSMVVCYDSCRNYYKDRAVEIGASQAIDYMYGKSSAAMVGRLRAEAGCNSAVFAVQQAQDKLAKEAAEQTNYLIYVRKSGEVGFRK